MVTEDLKQEAALTALNAMMAKGYLDICAINQVAELLGRDPRCTAHQLLRTLHCVHFHTMAPSLRDRIPELILECLGAAPTFRFGATTPTPAPVKESRPRLAFLRGLVP